MIDQLQEFVTGFPEWAQWAATALIGMIPFIESYLGSAIGVIAGVHPVAAAASAIVGNGIVVALIVLLTGAARDGIRRVARKETSEQERSPRRQRLRGIFERFGVPGVALLGKFVLPSHFTAAALVGFGASRRSVLIWELASVAIWGVVFTLLALLGIDLLHG